MRPVALLTCLVLAPAVAVAQDSPETVAARVGTNVESVPGSGEGVRSGRATAVIEAPFDRVVAAITDYGSYSEFMPHFRQSRVLSSRGQSALVYMQAAAFHDTVVLWANLRIRPRRSIGTTQVFEGRMVEGNLDQFTARWEISPLEDGQKALVVFELLIDPDLPFPTSIVTDENVRNAQRVLRALRARLTD
jgi:ribosome-associated toxin RatA of RatAB toxin-antitoxin module